ncbi:hypothetical protein ILYODFUR_017606 [Ilyodon furcidens]|uniref:FCH domain-containing protein n=1 Tax=Ilyodon furcidens TaxID=33524 RepID=A0ABV0SM13_9TELE
MVPLQKRDQFDNLEKHTQWGIEFVEKYTKFVKERSEIEVSYAKQISSSSSDPLHTRWVVVQSLIFKGSFWSMSSAALRGSISSGLLQLNQIQREILPQIRIFIPKEDGQYC